MGVYDREYYREEDRGFFLRGDRTAITDILLLTFGVYLVDWISNWQLQLHLELGQSIIKRPWEIFTLLTYGLLHDGTNIFHILMNMLMLWVFGRDIEGMIGKAQFLRLYAALIISSGLFWLVVQFAMTPSGENTVIGASGGVVGILVLFGLNFPRRTIYIWGVLPVPAWALIGLIVFGDVARLIAANPLDNVAYAAHVGGALFGLLYFKTGWSLASLIPTRMPRFRSRPKLRIHDEQAASADDNWQERVDDILAKISREGEASLTAKERKTLEEASRRYQQRRG